ncbi:MAG: hypothetical protein NVSMB42_15570 [Herpetosiphon sp.]
MKPPSVLEQILACKQHLAAVERCIANGVAEQPAELSAAMKELRSALESLTEDTEEAVAVAKPVTRAGDIAERERDLLSILMDSIPDGIYFKDDQGHFLHINRGQARNLGLADVADALGKTDFDFFDAVHAQEAWQDEQHILATGQPLLDRIEHYVGTNGQTVWVSATKVPFFDAAGQVRGIVGISRDITSRKSAEVALEHERTFLKTILASLSEGIVVCDAAGCITLFNDASQTFHNLQAEPVQAELWADIYDLYYTDGRTPMAKEDIPLYRALQGERVRDAEMMIIPKNGAARTLVAAGDVLLDAQGNKIGAVVAMHDITERIQVEVALRKTTDELESRVAERTAELRATNMQLQLELAGRHQVEQALRESEIRFRTLVEQSPLSTQILLPDGNTLLVNRAWEELWGVTLDQIPDYNILHDPQLVATGTMPYIQRAFAGEALEIPAIRYNPNATLSDRTRYADPVRWVRAFIYPVKDELGQISEVVLVHEDISEQRRSEAQLEESESRFRQLAENITEVFWMFDTQTSDPLYISPAFEKLWCRSRAMLGEEPDALLNTVYDADRELLETARVRQVAGERTVREYRIVLPDGSLRWIRDRGFPIHDPSGQVYRVAGIAEDITERREAEEERVQLLRREQAARAEAEAAIVLRDEFLSIASHELKTPVTSLIGYSQILERRARREQKMSERDLREIHVVVEQSLRLSRLIGSLLDISRIRLGHFTIEPRPVDIVALCQRLAEEIKPTLFIHTLQVTLPDVPVVVSGDELRLEQIIQNLVQNAVKYSPDGGEVRMSVERTAEHACLVVSDQGVGIPAEAQEHIFQRFYRAAGFDQARISGLGLGLYIVHEIVDRHGGTVTVQSAEGVGSTFTVRLPLEYGSAV